MVCFWMPSLYHSVLADFNTTLSHVSIALCTGQFQGLNHSLCFLYPSSFFNHCLCNWPYCPPFKECHIVGVLYGMENQPFSLCFFYLTMDTQGCPVSSHNLIVPFYSSQHKIWVCEYDCSFCSPLTFWIPSSSEQLCISCKPCTGLV